MSDEISYGLFDYVNSINDKNYIFDEATYSPKNYSQYVINTAFSYFPDTIFYANEANMMRNLSDKMHYDFLYFTIMKKKRFSKWNKKSKSDYLDIVSEYYDISPREAKELLDIIPLEQLEKIKNSKGHDHGK